MTPNIQYQSVPALDEATVPSVQYLQGQYIPLDATTGKIAVSDGVFLSIRDNGSYTTSTTVGRAETFSPDYENRVLIVVSSFQYKFKIPYKGL